MNNQQLEILKKDLSFAIWSIKQFMTQPMKHIDGYMYLRVFDGSRVPDSFTSDLIAMDTNLIEASIPELATMYEIKVLEYQKELAEKRLAELRGNKNG